MASLVVDGIHAYYGHIHALHGISVSVEQGEIVTLIGANGAGKSTTLKTISGFLRPRPGTILLDGEPIHGLPPHDITRRGVCLVPEGRRIFPRMTVRENLEMGAFSRADPQEIREDLDRVYDLFPRLKERLPQTAGTLSGGEQQMLAIGRGLMARPKVLLLDEPSMGLAPVLVELIFQTIQEINAHGVTILLVEQNALMALQIAKRGYVLETGRIVMTDRADALRANDLVRKSYLGEL
ncbi:MAG: ABC transporter ATP-binding protein [Bacillati bacterium ANGP1]|uniref:ABC transporter ATP-binding protein n=1 Tax=Candidatus Segetimicrobium genomatis TaxID=2569760 RepID=A0A537LI83_9BACT|nr:MAG: ABC transporter ATP-binding protein [Terrabacteria group bacterium ANGP1]